MNNPPYLAGPIDGVSDEVNACVPDSGTLHAYVWWASQTTHAPPWWHVGVGLTAIAHEAARQGFSVGEQMLKPMLWTALLGPSAAGKSTAIRRGVEFYTDYLAAFSAPDPFVMAEGSIPGIFEKLTEGWNDDLGRTVGILHQEEFSRLLDRKDTVAEMLMQLADGREIQRHKVSTRAAARQGQAVNDELRNPAVSALFATTYSSLRRVTHGHHLEGGLYSRMLWFVADPDLDKLQMLPQKRDAERRAALANWCDWGKWFYALEAQGLPRVIQVPETVYGILEASLFATAKERFNPHDRLNSTRMRAIERAYLIAGLFALSQGRLVVCSEDMDVAVNLVEKANAGIEGVDPELGGNELSQLTNMAFRAIQARGTDGLARTALYATLKTNKRMIDDVIATLCDEGSIREVRVSTGKRGRPPTFYVACGPTRYLGSAAPGDPVEALHKPESRRRP